MRPPRRQLAGVEEIGTALRAGRRLALLLARCDSRDPALRSLVEEARFAGIPVRSASVNDLRRMSRAEPPAELLALAGPDPRSDPAAVLAGKGPVWLLAGVSYPGNAGYAIRTAEVSGADGIFLDAGFDGPARRQALRASMHAERFLPVHWMPGDEVLDRASAAGRRLLAVEDVGRRAPWEVDLTGPVLFVIGGEGQGIPEAQLARCHEAVRIPMAGFIPAYNLQAAMAAVAVERLRQESE